MAVETEVFAGQGSRELIRSIDWRGAFWVASGVPALVLFSIGGIAGTTGKVAFVVWAASMVMGFIQSFTYAEIAGLFPNKSGGASIYGAAAWVRYSKVIAPLSVWCNWLAWSPVLSLGCSIAAAYILNALGPIPGADSPSVLNWVTAHAGTIAPDSPRVVEWLASNAGKTASDADQRAVDARRHRGVDADHSHLDPFHAQSGSGHVFTQRRVFHRRDPHADHFRYSASGHPRHGQRSEIHRIARYRADADRGYRSHRHRSDQLGELFASCSLEDGIRTGCGCVGHQWMDPGARGNVYRGMVDLCALKRPFATRASSRTLRPTPSRRFSTPVCFAFSFTPWFRSLSKASWASTECWRRRSSTVRVLPRRMAKMVGGSGFLVNIMVMLMILALMLSIMTAMAGSSRTLYQGSVDGWLPRYLDHVNDHGAPTHAMWTDLVFNLCLLAIAAADATSFFFILAVSNCCYIIFNFLNLNSGWLHRIDNGHIHRPFKAPTILLALGTMFSFVNAAFMGAGAKVWNPMALRAGAIAAALIIPVFLFRHYVQDKGKFPAHMLEDLNLTANDMGSRKAGILPYLTLVAGVIVVLFANWFFTLAA